MEVEIVKDEKNLIEMKVNDPTVVELLRVYLNENGVKFAAWKREHPTKPVIFRIEANTGTVKKAISDAIKAIKKDNEDILAIVKK